MSRTKSVLLEVIMSGYKHSYEEKSKHGINIFEVVMLFLEQLQQTEEMMNHHAGEETRIQ